MNKTLPVTGMTFSNRDGNCNECLNTKIEKVLKTCKHPLAFTIIRTVYCNEKIKFLKKEKCDSIETGVCSYGHPCYLMIIIRVIPFTSKTKYYMSLQPFHIAHGLFK